MLLLLLRIFIHSSGARQKVGDLVDYKGGDLIPSCLHSSLAIILVVLNDQIRQRVVLVLVYYIEQDF